MRFDNRYAKINVKFLVILIVLMVGLGGTFLVVRQVRRDRLRRLYLDKGQTAFEKEDWRTAWRSYKVYLGMRPDDVDILKKYADSRLSCRPLDPAAVKDAIVAYRRIIQLAPQEENAYDKLAMLYAGMGNFEGLAHIARTRIEHDPSHRKARLWLADALIRLGKTDDARKRLERFLAELEALPEKYNDHARACALLALIHETAGARTTALDTLDRAVDFMPASVEALVTRASFLRTAPEIILRTAPEIIVMSEADRLALARRDLDAADAIGTDNPRIRLRMGEEWIAHRMFDRAEAELRACESISQEALEGHFFDMADWTVARFIFASNLAIRKGDTSASAGLADDVLAELTEKRHRVRVLPNAIVAYIAQGKITHAKSSFDEYLDIVKKQEGPTESKSRLTNLQALMAAAEGRLYDVIDILQPVVIGDAASPELWRLVADAYSRTDQTRRAIGALTRYLSFRPSDPKMTLQLAREYLELQNWSNAFETARLAETLDPPDMVVTKLLRLEANIYVNISETAQQNAPVDTERFEVLSAELAELRRQNPRKVDVRILQAIIANYLEKPEEAERELKLAIDGCDEPLRARMQLSKHYVMQKRMADAFAACQSACQHHPELAEPWLYLSGLHVRNKDYESAADCARQGLRTTVEKWEHRALTIQYALVELSYLDRAVGISLLKELAEQDRQEVRARLLLLNIREIQESPDWAGELISELREAEGDSGLYWRLHQASLWLSSDAWRSKRSDIAEYLEYCIISDPGWSAPSLLLAKMHENLQDLDRVEEVYRQALIRNPSATDVADKLMTLLERQRRFSEAENVLQQIQADTQYSSTWHIRRAVNDGNFARAIEELTLRVSNNAQDADARILLARLMYWETGDVEGALALLDKAEAITPGSLALIAARVSILRAEGQEQEAQQILDDHVAQGHSFSAYVMRAAYLAQQGDLERAEQDYKALTSFEGQGAIGYQLWSQFYVRNQQLDKAITVLKQGLDAYDNESTLKRRLMQALFARDEGDDLEVAVKILVTLESEFPRDPELMGLRAVLLLQEATPQSRIAARAKLEEAVKVESSAVNAHRMLIGLLFEDGDYEAARTCAIRALGANPNNSVLLAAAGRAELLLQNNQIAVQMARRAMAEDPNSPDARYFLVEAALKSGDRTLLDEVETRIGPVGSGHVDERMLLSRVSVLVDMNRAQTAIPGLEAYCGSEQGAGSVTAIVTLGDLYRLTGDFERAWLKMGQAEQIDPNSQEIIRARVLLLIAQNRLEELATFSATLLAGDQALDTLITAARALIESESTRVRDEGLTLFEHLVEVAPSSVNAQLGLVSALCRTGNLERSKEVCQALLDQYPGRVEVLNDLAWLLQEHHRDYTTALDLVNRGLGLPLNNATRMHLLDTRGVILVNMNRLVDARSDFESVVELANADTEIRASALLQLGRICVKLDNLVQARDYLESASEIDRKTAVFSDAERSEIEDLRRKSEHQAAETL
jgi:tetratricopeptide (TPR) repeat protein